MYKKLIALAVSAAMIFGTALPAFAAANQTVFPEPAVSENPYMPMDTYIPELLVPEVSEESFPAEEGTFEEETSDKEAANVTENTEDAETPEEEELPAEPEVTEPSEKTEEESSEDDSAAADDTEKKEEAEKKEDTNKKDAEKSKSKEEKEKEAAIKYRNGLASYMRSKNSKLGKVYSRNLAQIFIDAGEKYNLDPTVLMAQAQRESTFSSKATSPYGYKGIMQTSDWLAKHYGYQPKDLYDPAVSIDVAARYLKSLKNTFGTYTLALCGYMYGGYAVQKGKFSKKAAWKVMNTRKEINEYLEKWNFV